MTTFSGGRTTVPQIFFNAKHMRGYDDIRQMDEAGRLEKEVEDVRVTPAPHMQPHWFHPWY
jgi:glutaredoxin-related protein